MAAGWGLGRVRFGSWPIARGSSARVPLVLTLVCVGCSPWGDVKQTKSYVKSCVLPTEQRYTIQGRWANLPIRISFHGPHWPSSTEIRVIQDAAEVWNQFFVATHGVKAFDSGDPGLGYRAAVAEQSYPACGGSTTLSDGVVLYKRWTQQTWTKSPQAIALTSSCIRSGANAASGLGTIYNAILEFNYWKFFTPESKDIPDLKSIVVHELGHVLGLDHSCGALAAPNTGKPSVACPAETNTSSYLVQAIMYPFMSPVSRDASGTLFRQVKTALTDNDQGRTNCAYE